MSAYIHNFRLEGSRVDWENILRRWRHEPDQTKRELQWKNWLHTQLMPYFHVVREVEGRTLRNSSVVWIDFLCKAQPLLLVTGFPRPVFGIEAKYPLGWGSNEGSDVESRCNEWLSQMVRYRHSRFWSKRDQEFSVIPAFILSAPPLTTLLESTKKDCLQNFFHKLGIGELHVRLRRAYDLPKALGGFEHEAILSVCFSPGLIFWNNVRGRSGLGIGRATWDDHLLELEEKEYHRKKKDNGGGV